MYSRKVRLQAAVVCVLLITASVCARADVITIEHIADGIRSHIDSAAEANGGVFEIEHEGETLELKLIRIHMEYLANLGESVQFACVDLVEADGTVYDVDFFMRGETPDALIVTETHVHKIDGQPRYAWEQKDDGTWERIAVEDAGEDLLGVLREKDAFYFDYRVTLPELNGTARLWLPLAQSDEAQTVWIEDIDAPVSWRIVEEPTHGNQVLFAEAGPEQGGQTISIRYRVQRLERSPYEAQASTVRDVYLGSERLVPVEEPFISIAADVTAHADTDLMKARELYNHTRDTIRYARYGEGWGRGDAVYACNVQSGNCSDFHAYFIALSRAAGIPARFISGAAIPSERNEGGVDGYHCWAEFYADGQWWPVDISEAKKHRMLSDYYFGRHPANRLEFSRGRDLVVSPAPESGPINFFAFPVLEVDGQPVNIRPEFQFQRISEQHH